MKQQVLFCLLLTIGAGTCNGYEVKGSFSKSYSSSSASASSSAFSSSFSSGDDANLNEITKSLNAGAQASATAFAQADAGGAKAGSGSFATAGSAASAGGFAGGTSGSGSSSKSDLQIGSGVQLGHGSHSVNSGSYSASGAVAGAGSTCTTCSGYAGNSGNSGSSSSKQNNVNSAGSASDSGSTSNVLVNNFEIPNDYSNPKSAPAFDKLIKGFESDNHNAAYSGSIEGSKSCCQGPFPGPKGSISDFKPAPPGGGAPPAWTPEEQQPTNTGTIGISTQLINSFPGSHGGIHDSKPAFDKPYNGGSIPVSVVVETPHQPQTHVPGSNAISVIGTLPGPTGGIYTSIPSGHQPEPQYVPVPQTPSQPGPSLDLIHSFPGKPGNIHDSKVVPCTGGWCQSNQQGYNVNQNSNTETGSISGNYKPEGYHPKFPDCSTGQCDEYGGKLACHGNDCFGPGKKPSNAHFSAGASANSNANHESGSININLSEPSTDTYQQSPCKSGNCNGKPTDAGGQSPQKPAVDLTPINVPSGSQQNGYPAPGSINFGVDHPIPSSPGSLCSGLECLLPGTKETPSSSSKDCSGAYCINVVPESQIIPSCSSGNCHNQQKNIQKSDSTSTVEQPIEAEPQSSPTHIQKETPAAIDKPHDQGPGASQDFLLPGNKPYHRHSIKPSHPKKEHEKPASEGYYTCTGTSCPLPKHPGQITSQPSQNFEPSKLTPFNIPEEYKGAGGHDRLYPGYTQKETPQLKPFKIPNEYKVKEDQEQKEETPVDIPVLIGGEPQIQGNKPVSHYTGNNGFVAGEVIVQKSEGTVVPVVDVFIPGSIKPGYQCSGSQCGGYKPTTNDGFVQGTNSGVQSSSSGAHNQGNVHGNDCSGGWCKIPIAGGFNGAVSGSQADTVNENLQGNFQGSGCTGGKCGTELNAGSNSGSGSYGGDCTSGNCGLNGGLSGSQSGASSENIQGYSQGSGCTGGKCGTGAGSHSGSGSYGGGCTSGNCGLNGGLSGSQSGASSENIQGYSQGSGCTGGKCGSELNAGSNSGSGSYGGGCTSGNCGLNGGLSGSQSGASSENIQGYSQGSGCTGGKCGSELNAESNSGSGSYGGGCTSGNCGLNGGLSGSQSGASSENIQGYSQGSGCTGGKCGSELNAGSNSGSGSYGGGCTSGNCGLNGGLSGSQSGASSENIQGYSQGSGCTGGKCGSELNAESNSGSGSYGGGCTSGKCGLNGGLSGSQTGASSENIQGNFQGSGCKGGKCGTGAGSHSGSGSYLGSGSYGGAKGGCKGGSCGFSGNNGAYGGAFSSSSSFGGSGSGGYSSHGSGSKAFSSSGSGAFLSNAQGGGFGGLPLLKELINQSIKVGDFHSGAGAFSGSSAYSGGGSVAHSSAYSSAGSFSAK